MLQGLIKRSDGDDIRTVIWFCDLRDSTPLAEALGRETFLAAVNQFFEATAGAALDHGGEFLRFIGGAALAIFLRRDVRRGGRREIDGVGLHRPPGSSQ